MLRSLRFLVPVSLCITCGFHARAQDQAVKESHITGRLMIDVQFTETEFYRAEIKDETGWRKIRTSAETSGNFHSAQNIRINTDTEGESFLVLDESGRALSGNITHSVSGMDSTHSNSDSPETPPTSSTYQGSASGIIDAANSGQANISHAGDGGPLMASVPLNFTLQKSDGQNTTRIPHWEGFPPNRKLVVNVTKATDVPVLPSKGQREDFSVTMQPAPPPGEPRPAMDSALDSATYTCMTTKLPKGGYIITCSDTVTAPPPEPDSTPHVRKTEYHSHRRTVTARIVILPGPPAPADFIIQPQDPAAYAQWVPVPKCDAQEVQDLYGTPAPIIIRASLVPKDPKKLADGSPMDFFLTDVSKNKGRCGNEPKNLGSGDPVPGLRFAKNQPPGVTVDSNNPLHASIEAPVVEGVVAVEAVDAGAYGKLQVTALAQDLTGIYKAGKTAFIRIPQDDNENHIADAWEKQKDVGIFAKKYPPLWDEDNTPDTGSSNKGDGLTLYEEYRGFVTLSTPDQDKPAWQRLKPEVKKMFVYPQGDDKELFKAGARLFEAVQGSKIYFIADDDGVSKDDLGTTGGRLRWFNFNSTTNDGVNFKGQQFAVNIIDDPSAHISTNSAPDGYDTDILSRAPEQVEAIHISRPYVEHDVIEKFARKLPPNRDLVPYPADPSVPPPPQAVRDTWLRADANLKKQGVDVQLATLGTRMMADQKTLVNKYITFAVMHELGHASGAIHHRLAESLKDDQKNEDKYYSDGDVDCAMRYWDTEERQVVDNFELRLRFFAGFWDPSATAPSGGPWHFCSGPDCHPIMHLVKKP